MQNFALAIDGDNVMELQEVTETEDRSTSETEFQWALRVRNERVLRRLLNEDHGSSYSTTNDSLSRNPLHIACINGYTEIAEILLNNIQKILIDVNGTDDYQLTGKVFMSP